MAVKAIYRKIEKTPEQALALSVSPLILRVAGAVNRSKWQIAFLIIVNIKVEQLKNALSPNDNAKINKKKVSKIFLCHCLTSLTHFTIGSWFNNIYLFITEAQIESNHTTCDDLINKYIVN